MIDDKVTNKLRIMSLLSMIMVVFLHSYNINKGVNSFSETNSFIGFINSFIQNIISSGVTQIAVPIFFIISGYLLFQGFTMATYKNKVYKRIKTLLLPYIFWATLVVTIYYMLQSLPGVSHYFNGSNVEDFSMSELFFHAYIKPMNYPLWFLRDLIFLVLFSLVIYFFIKKIPKIFLIILTLAWLLGVSIPKYYLSFYTTESLLFFSFGSYLAIYHKKTLSLQIKDTQFWSLIIVYFSFLIVKTVFITINPDNEMLVFIIMHKLAIIIGIFTLFFYLDKYDLKFLQFFTQFTFLYYVFHEPLRTILTKGQYSILGTTPFSSIFIYFSTPLIVLISLTIFGVFLKKYLPRFGLIITGNRL